jgi:hypothetical protein
LGWLAITLFTLRPERSMADFRQHTLDFVRPRMVMMPAVLGFRDYAVTGTQSGATAEWDAIEVIEITNPEAFERDNSGPHGAAITEDWLTWVEQFTVLFCENLAAHKPSDVRGSAGVAT